MSITTRIKTEIARVMWSRLRVLDYCPLQQGLRLFLLSYNTHISECTRLLSITTRIKTAAAPIETWRMVRCTRLLSITTRIKTRCHQSSAHKHQSTRLLSITTRIKTPPPTIVKQTELRTRLLSITTRIKTLISLAHISWLISTRLLSITTRIKTLERVFFISHTPSVLDYCPLQQGLRHTCFLVTN